MRTRTSSRLGAIAGIAGPAAFTCAWIVASLRQPGHSAADVQLSGLAAMDARDPVIMIGGFVLLGACSVAFGGSLHEVLGGTRSRGQRPGPAGLGSRRARFGSRGAGLGPRLIQGAGALTVAAGLLRRDHMMLTPPPGAAGAVGESWHNQAHDAVSSVIYITLVAVPLLLAVRFRDDADWRRLSGLLLAGSAATAGLLGVFGSAAFASWDPVLQRIAVTIPLALLTAVAARLVTLCPAGAAPGVLPVTRPGSGPSGGPPRSGRQPAR